MVADSETIPVAPRADEWMQHPARMGYRLAVLMLATTLASFVFGRGYGLDGPVSAGAAPARRTQGEWTSVPWHYIGARGPNELHLAVDSTACARVVRHDVVETPDQVRVTVWRRRMHPSCVRLSVVIRLRAPVGQRQVVDGGQLTN